MPPPNNLKSLVRECYNKLNVTLNVNQHLGLTCKHFIEKELVDNVSDVKNFAVNLKYTAKAGRVMKRDLEAIMAAEGVNFTPWTVERVPTRLVALSEDFCSGCQEEPYIEIDYQSMKNKSKAVDRMFQNYLDDCRRANMAMNYFLEELDRRSWKDGYLAEDFYDQCANGQANLRWALSCSVQTFVGKESRKGKDIQRKEQRQLARVRNEEAPGFGYHRRLCPACRDKVIL